MLQNSMITGGLTTDSVVQRLLDARGQQDS